jgi:tetratricopeptide (TPR) repeat protein
MASEDEFDPAAALAALESLQPETSGALAAMETMLSGTSDLLQLASMGFSGIPGMGGASGALGTVSSVVGLPAKVLNIIDEYTEIKRRYDQHPDPAAHPEGVDALIYNAGALVASGRLDDALSVYDDISARFGADCDPDVARSVRHSRINALQMLNRLGRFEETLTRYDRIAEIYGTDPTSTVAVEMLSARLNRLEALGSLQRADEALWSFDEIVAVCDDLDSDDTEGLAARIEQVLVAARSMKSLVLLRQGKPDEALAASGKTGERSGTDEAVQALSSAEQSLARAVVFHQSGRWQEAIDAYDQVLVSYSKDGSVKSLAMTAACSKAALLVQLRRFEDAVRACHDARHNFRGERIVRVTAALVEIDAYRGLGRQRKAVRACDEAVRLIDAAPEAGSRQVTAHILLLKALSLLERHREGQALSAFEDLDRRFRDDPDPAVRREVAQALFRKGEALRQDGRQDQADAAMDTLVARYSDDTDPLLMAVTALARSRKTSVPGIDGAK